MTPSLILRQKKTKTLQMSQTHALCTLHFSNCPVVRVSAERLLQESPVLYSWWEHSGHSPIVVTTIHEETASEIAAYLLFGTAPPQRGKTLREQEWHDAQILAAADYLGMERMVRLLKNCSNTSLELCIHCGLPFLPSDNHKTACAFRPCVRRGNDWACAQCGLKPTLCHQGGTCPTTSAFHFSGKGQ